MDHPEKVKQAIMEASPLYKFLGVRLDKFGADLCVLALPFQEGFIQAAGVVAGGIMAALADEAMALVVVANLEPGQSTATIEMNLRFLRPLEKGGIKAEARLVKKGKKIVTVKADIKGPEEELLAEAGASFMVKE